MGGEGVNCGQSKVAVPELKLNFGTLDVPAEVVVARKVIEPVDPAVQAGILN